jgi:hypothetical protein
MSGEMKRGLAARPKKDGSQVCEGCLMPEGIKTCDEICFTPERVIPIIFLPGIMGSNLRLTPKRQAELKRKERIVWKPDDKLRMGKFGTLGGSTRQQLLDPEGTEVDSYDDDPDGSLTGQGSTYMKQRENVQPDANSPFLRNDVRTNPRFKTARRKACERGWGELFYGSYTTVLNRLETMMNAMFSPEGQPTPEWEKVLQVDPKNWGATTALPPVTEADLRQIVDNCCFPVHVCGYNWLQSNGESAKKVAVRIEAIMARYLLWGRRCEKVILVTHSMGGLVARALCHPAYGKLEKKILGIVHGVQPAIGAGAAYYRMLAGWEDGGNFEANVIGWTIGGTGSKITPILGNGCGGMELLPNQAYGNGWLQIFDHKKQLVRSLPEKGDPYEEIYARDSKDVWWGLLREDWINPAKQPKAGLQKTRDLLKEVREFHQTITPYYHPLSYAHYACDPQRRAFKNVVWDIAVQSNVGHSPQRMQQVLQENPKIFPPRADTLPAVKYYDNGSVTFHHYNDEKRRTMYWLRATMRPSADPGDQTVPMDSAEHQLHSGQFKGISRQTGYEHQGSYQDENALASTLYGIVQIAKTMKWD